MEELDNPDTAGMPTKVIVSMTVEGRGQWSLEDNVYGETRKQSHHCEVIFSESIEQHDAIASALLRLISAFEIPSPDRVIARLAVCLLKDENDPLVQAANARMNHFLEADQRHRER